METTTRQTPSKRRYQRRCSVTEQTIAAVRKLSFSFFIDDEPKTPLSHHDCPSLLYLQHDAMLSMDSSSTSTSLGPILSTGPVVFDKDGKCERGAIRRLSLIYTTTDVCDSSDGTKLPSSSKPETLRVILEESVQVNESEKEGDAENQAPDAETEILITSISNKKRRLR